ncbi:MFS transporter [bacterium]|nr:MFS transporter [bacterium]
MKVFSMRAFLVKIYAFRLLEMFIPVYPVYLIMFTDYGLSPVDIAWVFVAWSIALFTLELPSGALADRYSRRKVLIFGQILNVLGLLCWLFYKSFWGFFFGLVLWGAKQAMMSGTFEAFVYDELKALKCEDQYAKVIGRNRAVMSVGLMISGLAASPMVLLGYDATIIATIVSAAASGLVLLTFSEVRAYGHVAEEGGYLRTLGTGLRQAVTIPGVLRMLVFMMISYGFLEGMAEFFPLLIRQSGLPDTAVGLYLAAIAGLQALAFYVSHRFEHYPNRFFHVLLVGAGLCVIASAWILTPAALLLFCFYTAATHLIFTVYDAKMQHRLPSATRATITSVRGTFGEIIVIATYMSYGLLAEAKGAPFGFLVMGGVIVAIGVGYLANAVFSFCQRARRRKNFLLSGFFFIFYL